MRLLRRVVLWQAAVWAVSGVSLILFPVLVLENVFDQLSLNEYAWVRMVGIMAFGIALLMVLVAQRIEDLWWWSWAFVLMTGGIAVLALLNAAIGVHPGSSSIFWWMLGTVNGLFTTALLAGLAGTGIERRAE